MKIKLLGTGAGEGFPATFCQCEVCQQARKLGGKNIRSRNQAVVDHDLIIDFPEDAFYHSTKFNISYADIFNVLITHSHGDHFAPTEFESRMADNGKYLKEKMLTIYGNNGVIAKFPKCFPASSLEKSRDFIRFQEIKAYDVFSVGDYTVTAFPAQHMTTEQALIYLIEKDGKSIFFGTDTGTIYPEIIDYLVQNHKHIDILILDCTKGYNHFDYTSHMSLYDAIDYKKEFEDKGVLTKDSKVVVTHFTHNCGQLHEDLVKIAGEYGILVAYDGIELEA